MTGVGFKDCKIALDEAGGGVDRETRNVVTNYMQFIQQRATGQLMTTAEWMRHFVTSHPDYKEDSVVTQRIAYDLMERCHHIGIGTCAISFIILQDRRSKMFTLKIYYSRASTFEHQQVP